MAQAARKSQFNTLAVSGNCRLYSGGSLCILCNQACCAAHSAGVSVFIDSACTSSVAIFSPSVA